MMIAVTGGLGSGKSTIARILAALLPAVLISSDAVCRQELTPGHEGFDTFVCGSGSKFLGKDGNLNRRALSRAAFADKSLREELEGILHPIVRKKITEANRPAGFLVAEVPLVYESGWQDDFSTIVSVRSRRYLTICRVAQRDSRSDEEIQNIMSAQMSPLEKERLADFCIDNSGTFCSTFEQVSFLTLQLKEILKKMDS